MLPARLELAARVEEQTGALIPELAEAGGTEIGGIRRAAQRIGQSRTEAKNGDKQERYIRSLLHC